MPTKKVRGRCRHRRKHHLLTTFRQRCLCHLELRLTNCESCGLLWEIEVLVGLQLKRRRCRLGMILDSLWNSLILSQMSTVLRLNSATFPGSILVAALIRHSDRKSGSAG